MPEDWGDENGPDFTPYPEKTLPPPPGGYQHDYEINNNVDSKVRDVGGGNGDIRDPFGAGGSGRNDGTPTAANGEAAKLIGKARNKLDAALDAYTEVAGPNSTIMDVNASNTSFQSITVENRVDEAESKLDAAVEPATEGQQMNILGLKHVAVFIRYAARCQKALGDGFEEVSFMAKRLYNESLILVEQGNRQARKALSDARDAFEIIDDEVESEAFRTFGSLTEGAYEDKREQLDSELAALQELRDGIWDMKGGVKELQTAVPAFLDERYQVAERGFAGANADFAIARTSFRLSRGSREVEKKVLEVIGVAQTLEQASKDLRRAAQAQINDERLVFYEARRAAEQHIESNDIVRRMRTMNNLVT